MSVRLGKLARRYARAYISSLLASVSRSELSILAGELTSFVSIWNENRELSLSLLNPSFKRDDRIGALRSVIDSLGYRPETARFIVTIAERDRLQAITEISSAFSELADKAEGIKRVTITSAREIGVDEQREIESGIRNTLKGSKVFCSWTVEPQLLGGLTVEFDGQVLDGSLRGKLHALERELIANG